MLVVIRLALLTQTNILLNRIIHIEASSFVSTPQIILYVLSPVVGGRIATGLFVTLERGHLAAKCFCSDWIVFQVWKM